MMLCSLFMMHQPTGAVRQEPCDDREHKMVVSGLPFLSSAEYEDKGNAFFV